MPRPRTAVEDAMLLNAALEGLEIRKQQIEEQIRQVRSMMGSAPPSAPAERAAAVAVSTEEAPALPMGSPSPKTGRKRLLSAAARKRIAAAQKKRWAEFRKNKAEATAQV